MSPRIMWMIVSPSLMLAVGCGKSGSAAERELSKSILLPDEGETLVDPEEDPSVSIGGGGGLDMDVTEAGDNVSVAIPFSSANGDVTGAGIRFGDSGPIRTVNFPNAQGQSQGTMQFQFGIPDDICGNLSNICHDIRCYEFAVTSAGRVSAANINSLALVCGGCDEPSCQGLIDTAICPDDPGTSPGLGVVCSEGGESCPNGKTLEYCIDIDADRCWYQVGGQRIDCDCDNTSACAQTAVQACL